MSRSGWHTVCGFVRSMTMKAEVAAKPVPGSVFRTPHSCRSRGSAFGGTRGAQVRPFLQLLLVDQLEHRLTRRAHHGHHELGRCVRQSVAVLVVDHVTAWLPERATGLDHTLWLTLELEPERALHHVAERRA